VSLPAILSTLGFNAAFSILWKLSPHCNDRIAKPGW
jgi:hypothetical protein